MHLSHIGTIDFLIQMHAIDTIFESLREWHFLTVFYDNTWWYKNQFCKKWPVIYANQEWNMKLFLLHQSSIKLEKNVWKKKVSIIVFLMP